MEFTQGGKTRYARYTINEEKIPQVPEAIKSYFAKKNKPRSPPVIVHTRRDNSPSKSPVRKRAKLAFVKRCENVECDKSKYYRNEMLHALLPGARVLILAHGENNPHYAADFKGGKLHICHRSEVVEGDLTQYYIASKGTFPYINKQPRSIAGTTAPISSSSSRRTGVDMIRQQLPRSEVSVVKIEEEFPLKLARATLEDKFDILSQLEATAESLQIELNSLRPAVTTSFEVPYKLFKKEKLDVFENKVESTTKRLGSILESLNLEVDTIETSRRAEVDKEAFIHVQALSVLIKKSIQLKCNELTRILNRISEVKMIITRSMCDM